MVSFFASFRLLPSDLENFAVVVLGVVVGVYPGAPVLGLRETDVISADLKTSRRTWAFQSLEGKSRWSGGPRFGLLPTTRYHYPPTNTD